jgi:hypothetical protein|nr:hypothetical protein [Neorhizobium tomejilense]
MSNWNKLIGIDPVKRLNKYGHAIESRLYDIDDLLVIGRRVLRDGISATTLHVVGFDKERSLVALMEDGHSVHMNSHAGSSYFTSQIMVFRYRTEVVGNQVHMILPYSRLFQFPLKEGAGF